MKYIRYIACSLFLFVAAAVYAQERVLVSTDKECYVAGEDLWYTVYCIDEATGEYSSLSSTAYLQFFSREGLAATQAVALIDGRGCGKFQIPMEFATGNYSIVSFTKAFGGDSKGEFKGKIISVFNTITAAKVKDGVVESDGIMLGVPVKASGNVAVETGTLHKGVVPVKIRNNGKEKMEVSVSVYHYDQLSRQVGNYNKASLLSRRGDFERCEEVDFVGEVLSARVVAKDGDSCEGTYVYLSGIGSADDLYVNKVGKDGIVSFNTGNIMGNKELVFEVAGDTSKAYNIEIVRPEYNRIVAQIPQLELDREWDKVLKERGRRMQISRRFASDTLYGMFKVKDKAFVGNTPPLEYELDDYTRFQNLEEVLREYVKFVRVRRNGNTTELKVLWGSQGRSLALVDGVPINDPEVILGLDQQLVKKIVVYPKRYMLNYFVYDGVVNFITYKGDLGGLKLSRNVSVINYNGASWPLAFYGSSMSENERYPNFNSTIYWNPMVTVPAGGVFEFDCILPQYKGDFKIVIEGLDESKNEIYGEKML